MLLARDIAGMATAGKVRAQLSLPFNPALARPQLIAVIQKVKRKSTQAIDEGRRKGLRRLHKFFSYWVSR